MISKRPKRCVGHVPRDQGNEITHSLAVESRPVAIVEAWNCILSEIEANDFSQDDIFAVHLAVEEAFVNAVKHGNKMDPGKEVKIDYSVSLDKIEISLTDEGGGFNPVDVPDPRYGENLYKSEWRGLFLVRAYMDVVDFNEQGNCVHMVKYKRGKNFKSQQSQSELIDGSELAAT